MSEILVEIRAHILRELQLERKVCGGCVESISGKNVFQERFIWEALVDGLILAQFLQYGRSSQGNKRQHRKVSLSIHG